MCGNCLPDVLLGTVQDVGCSIPGNGSVLQGPPTVKITVIYRQGTLLPLSRWMPKVRRCCILNALTGAQRPTRGAHRRCTLTA